MSISWLIPAILLLLSSGVPGIFLGRRRTGSQLAATLMAVAGAVLGIPVALASLMGGADAEFAVRGPLANLTLHFHLDPLAAFFLVPIFLMAAVGSVYGMGYWQQIKHPGNGRRLRLCYGLLHGAMALVVMAGDSIAFLFAWEVMALSAFFLVSTEENKEETRAAGWLYLVSTHISTLALFALFCLLHLATGTFEFRLIDSARVGLGLRTAIFLVSLFGFGLKAGIMPLHFWLPSAHANAPSHVSATLSGILLKMGVYGLLRSLSLLPNPPASWGGLVLLLGTASAILGVLFALGQHDLKRLLAYHSIENIGIILMGLGLALLGQSRGRPEWVVLGLAGCLLHVWNHGLFKSLLFLAAGSVIHRLHTREIDLMGGLARAMPKTSMMFCIGAAAICGLPPLNGFVSELLIYLGLFGTLTISSGPALAAPALALVGALAVACFVKAYSAVFLGFVRTAYRAPISESPWSMTGAMGILAACCLLIGFMPAMVVMPLQTVANQWARQTGSAPAIGALAPLQTLTPLTLAFGGFLVAIFFLARRLQASVPRLVLTWDCGYAQPTARMQYTASSLAQILLGLFRSVLRVRSHRPGLEGTFPRKTGFHSHVGDVVLDGMLTPLWQRFRAAIESLRFLQQGSVQQYVFYILVILTLLLVLTLPLKDVFRGLLGGQSL